MRAHPGGRRSTPTRRDVLAAAAGAAAVASAPACVRTGRAMGPTAPGLLVVAIDGLRADHLGTYGYDRATSPRLDALAAEGVVFEQAFASAPLLLPAHVSLLTGCQPWVARRYLPNELGVSFERRWFLPKEVPHLAVELLAQGWTTAAFVDHPDMSPLYGLRTGFQLWVDSSEEEQPGLGGLERRILQWVRGVEDDRPFFGYVQLHDLERSWSRPDVEWERYFYPPRPELTEAPPVGLTDDVMFAVPYSRRRGGLATLGSYEAAYDGHLRKLDHQLQALLDALRTLGRYEDTTIVVVGSHGLQLGEAGLYLRAGRYSVADLHVPLVVRPRAGLLPTAGVGARLRQLFGGPDLAPTLLALEGLSVPPGTHGRSHAAALVGAGPPPEREVVFSSCGIQEGCALFGPRYVLEYLVPARVAEASLLRSWFGEHPARTDREPHPRARFYDRTVDPHPPLSGSERAVAGDTFERYRLAAAEWIRTMEEVRRALHRTSLLGPALDEEVVERLRRDGFLPPRRS